MNGDVVMVTCGPVEHGIVRFGRQLHRAAVDQGFTGTSVHEDDARQLIRIADSLAATVRVVHLQANDWLFSDADQTAAQRITDFAGALRARGASLVLTLHDLPHAHVSRELFLRRCRVYRQIISQAAAIAVSSDHERMLIHEAAQALSAVDDPPSAAVSSPGITVIPLPVSAPDPSCPDSPSEPPGTPTVGVLGFLYPGKGHDEIVRELAHFPVPLAVVAIGAPSRGHEALLPELIAQARDVGLEFRCTGFVPDTDLAGHLHAVTVPVAAAPQVSASASINTWIAAGRRPLVLAGRYTRELERRMPGSVELFEPGGLRAAVTSALAEPSSTRLPDHFRPEPSTQEVALAYLRWLDAVDRPRFGTDGSGH